MIGFLIFAADHSLLKISDPLRAALGYSPLEELPRRWEDFLVEAPEPFAAADSLPAWREGYLHRRAGEKIRARIRLDASNLPVGLILVEVDLVWRSSGAPEALDRSGIDPASLSFLTTVSHELRVSLNGVVGFAGMLAEGKLEPEQRVHLEKLQACSGVLLSLVNDILEYSRAVACPLESEAEDVALADFAREVVGLFKDRARRKGLDLSIEVNPEAEVRARVPKLRVTQVLSNLISNAIKFTERGWVRVGVSVVPARESIEFRVEDTGPGVPEADVEKVFRPFAQSGEGIPAAEGSGLGLAISKNLAERMGGSLRLLRPARGGSLFVFVLPMRVTGQSERLGLVGESRDTAQTRARARPVAARSSRRPRVLVVEDNQLNADILSHFLRDYGAYHEVVENGRAAVETYEDGKFDLILMDVMLPEMNGYEATERILAASKRQTPVPIVGVTAKVFRRDQARCFECGMVEVVHKPVDFKVLKRVLDRLLFGENPLDEAEDGEAVTSKANDTAMAKGSVDYRSLEEYIGRMDSGSVGREGVVEAALAVMDGEVKLLQGAIELGDRENIGLRAHSLKGAFALLGARDAFDLAKGLEAAAARSAEPLRAEHWGSLLLAAYANFKEAARKYLRAEQSSLR